MDFLLDHNAVIDAKNRVLFLNDEVIPLITDPHISGENVYCADEIAVAPLAETSVTCTRLPSDWCRFWGIQFIPAARKTDLEIRSSSVKHDGTVTLNIFNHSPGMLRVRKGCKLSHAHPLSDGDSLVHIDAAEIPSAPLSDKEIAALCKRLNLLQENFSEEQFSHITEMITKYYSVM